jgi:hypothetical protein
MEPKENTKIVVVYYKSRKRELKTKREIPRKKNIILSFSFVRGGWQTYGQVRWGGQGVEAGPSACRRDLFDITRSWA